MVFGSAIGPAVTGFGLDFGVGIETQYVGVSVYFVFATIMMTVGIQRARPLLPLTA